MNRAPIVAGMFYPSDPVELARQASALCLPEKLAAEELLRPKPLARMVMLPHAGYVYSGRVAGLTLAQVDLPQDLVLLGPCHRVRGQGLSVWGSGKWVTPLGEISVAEDLAAELLNSQADFVEEKEPHLQDHCLEVLLPLLKMRRPDLKIVPVAVSAHEPAKLRLAALTLAEIIHNRTVSGLEAPALIVSSDMSHYLPQAETTRLDNLALEKVLALDGPGLYQTVSQHNISMCGVLPATLALQTCKALGAKEGRLVKYATSGEVSGDFKQVVGYAGVVVECPPD